MPDDDYDDDDDMEYSGFNYAREAGVVGRPTFTPSIYRVTHVIADQKLRNAHQLDEDARFRADQLEALLEHAERLRRAERTPFHPDNYANILAELERAAKSARRLLRFAPHERLQTAVDAATAFLQKIEKRKMAEQKFEELLDRLASLLDFRIHQQKLKLLTAIECREKLGEVSGLIFEPRIKNDFKTGRHRDQFLFDSEVDHAQNMWFEMVKDKNLLEMAMNELRAEHSCLSQIIARKPGKETLQRLQRKELPDLIADFNNIEQWYRPDMPVKYVGGMTIPAYTFKTMLNVLERQLSEALQEVNEDETAELARQLEQSHEEVEQAQVPSLLSEQEGATVDEERDLLHKQISSLEAAIARLRGEREDIGEASNQQQQTLPRPTPANGQYLERIAELEQTLGREFMLVEEKRQEENQFLVGNPPTAWWRLRRERRDDQKHDDDHFAAADSGAAAAYPKQCSEFRKDEHVMIKGRPCKVVEMSTSKTGEHGHAKVHLIAVDIFTGATLEDICPSTLNMDVPVINRKEYMLIEIDDDYATLMDPESWGTKEYLKLPDGEVGDQIRNAFEKGGRIMVATVAACGEEMILGYRVMNKDN